MPQKASFLKQYLLENDIYKSLYEHHPDAIYVMDLNGNYVASNPSTIALTGYSREEFLHLSFVDLIVSEDLQRTIDHFNKTVKGEPQNYENAIFHKDGNRIELQVANVPIVVNQQIIGVYGIARDITEQKQTENKLRKSEAQLAHAQHIAKIGNWDRDESIDISYWSNEMFHIFGLVPNQTGYVSQETFYKYIHPDDLDKVKRSLKDASRGIPIDMEYRIIRPNGEVRVLQSLRDVTFGEQGKVRLRGVVQDVTERKREERLLKESEQRYKSLVKYNPVGVCAFDINGRFTEVNPAYHRIIGYSDQELFQMTYRDLICKEELKRSDDLFLEALRGELLELELRLRHKNGHYVEVISTNIPIIINNETVGVYCITKDITEQKQATEEIRVTKEQLESFINHTAESISVIDREGKFLRINRAFEKLYGWSELEIINHRTPFPQSESNEINHWMKMVGYGRQITGVETKRTRKDGTVIEISATVSPIRDVSGNVIAMSTISRDITERKRAEEALTEAEAKYRSLVEDTLVGVYIIQDCRYSYVNPRLSEIFGYTQDEILALEYSWLLVATDDRAMVIENIEKRINGETKSARFQCKAIKKDESIIDVEVHGTVTIMNGKPAIIGVLMDITEQKRHQELLRASEKLSIVGQLAAGVAHEIRNPLASIKGFIQLLQEKVKSYPQYFSIILSELNRINTIVSEFVVLAKPQAVNFEPKSVVNILQDIVPLLETQAILNNVQIFTVYEPDVPLINCEENQIKQVFINILKNSIDAMPSGGNIYVDVKKHVENQIWVRFADEGCGIPEELISKLGEPFYTTKEMGTGLGLMISRKIIEHHNGKIQISSTVGKGTTIDLFFTISDLQNGL